MYILYVYANSIQIRNRQSIHNLDFPTQLIQCLLRSLVAQPAGLFLGDEDKVIRHQMDALLHVVLLRESSVDFAQVDNEGVLDAEDGVRGLVGVVAEVEGSGCC